MPLHNWLLSALFCAANVTAAALWVAVFHHEPARDPALWPTIDALVLYFMGCAHFGAVMGVMHAQTRKRHRPSGWLFWPVVAWCAVTFAVATALGFWGFVVFAAPAC